MKEENKRHSCRSSHKEWGEREREGMRRERYAVTCTCNFCAKGKGVTTVDWLTRQTEEKEGETKEEERRGKRVKENRVNYGNHMDLCLATHLSGNNGGEIDRLQPLGLSVPICHSLNLGILAKIAPNNKTVMRRKRGDCFIYNTTCVCNVKLSRNIVTKKYFDSFNLQVHY